VAFADGDLIDGQETETVIAGGADLLDEAPLVDLLDGVPGQPEVLGYLFDGQIPAEIGHGLLKSFGGAPEGAKEVVGLGSDTTVPASDLSVWNEKLNSCMGQVQVSDPTHVVAVNGLCRSTAR
jgi:hypothetical protein